MPTDRLSASALEPLAVAGRAVFRIHGMWCASCAMALQRAILRVPGVDSATVNFTSASALLTWRPNEIDFNKLIARIDALGYEIALMSDENASNHALAQQLQRLYIQLGVAVFFGMWSMLGSWILYLNELPAAIQINIAWLTVICALPVILYSGLDFYRAASKTLRVGVAGMDAMVSMGVWGSTIVSIGHLLLGQTDVYVDAATMLIAFLLVGRLIEIKAKQECQLAIDALRQLAPEVVTRYQDAAEEMVSVQAIRLGEQVLVRAGERIAVDGRIVHGQSQLDCALLSGEAYPVSVDVGEHVVAGAINITAPLIIQVEKVFGQRRIDVLGLRMLELFGGRSTLAMTAETFIRILFPLTIIAALMSFAYYLYTGMTLDSALLGSLSVLVAACPCAVGLALPLAYALGSRKAARAGVLWRDPASIEQLAQAKTMAFDKTGTLTMGRLEVSHVHVAAGWDATTVLQLAAQAEAGSAHPIAAAIRQRAKTDGCEASMMSHEVTVFAQGVAMRLQDASMIYVGSHAWMQDLGVRQLPGLAAHQVYVAHNDDWIGSVQLQDQPRRGLKAMLAQLQQQQKLVLCLLSGDSEPATTQLVQQLDGCFQAVHSRCSPEDKAVLLQQIAQRPVVFVGDGANDALVLASADCGIAIPGASSVAVAAAGVVITQGGVEQVSDTLQLARQFYRVVRQNLFFSIVYNLSVVGFLFVAGVTPFAAAIAMLLSSLSVLLNTLRLA